MDVNDIEKLLDDIESASSRYYADQSKSPRRILAEFLHGLQTPRLRYAFVCLEHTQVMNPGGLPLGPDSLSQTVMWTNVPKYQLEFFDPITGQWEPVDREVPTHDHSGPLCNTGTGGSI